MKTGQLKVDVFSTFKKGHLYGKAGEVVKIITQSIDVLIVESKKGDRYSVNKEKVLQIKHGKNRTINPYTGNSNG